MCGPVPSAASCAQPPLTERRRRRGWCRPAALTAGQCHPHRGPVPPPPRASAIPPRASDIPTAGQCHPHRGPVQPLPRAGPCDGRHAERVRARAQSARESLLRKRKGSRPGAERKSRGNFRNARKLPNADRARASRVCERYGRNDAGMRADTASAPVRPNEPRPPVASCGSARCADLDSIDVAVLRATLQDGPGLGREEPGPHQPVFKQNDVWQSIASNEEGEPRAGLRTRRAAPRRGFGLCVCMSVRMCVHV